MLGKMEWFEHPARVVQNGVKPETQAGRRRRSSSARRCGMEELLSALCVGDRHDQRARPRHRHDVRRRGRAVRGRQGHVPDGERHLPDRFRRLRVDRRPEDRRRARRLFLRLPLRQARQRRTTARRASRRGRSSPARRPRSSSAPAATRSRPTSTAGSRSSSTGTGIGKKDQNSSCWVRVAQPWAGKGYGMFSLPRVGDEVVVHFLDGDPDRPLVIGAVYNNDNMMAWTLPDAGHRHRLQEPHQRGRRRKRRPTSCASTTRRTASTSGSTPSATSTARSSTTRSTGSATTSRSRSR